MDRDIQDIFREKNREILIANLKYDLDKNIDNLLGTITNMFNKEFEVAIENINTIVNDASISLENNFVSRVVNSMKLDCFNRIDELIKNKKNVLAYEIGKFTFEKNEMDKYFNLVFKTTKTLKDDIHNYFKEVCGMNDFSLDNYDNSELASSRIKFYLENRLYGKLETKMHMEIMIRDNNLINKAKESYERYQEITEKTVNNN